MGMNHYIRGLEGDDPDDPGLHVGKSSGSWAYSLRVHEDLGLVDIDSWTRFIEHRGQEIVDEDDEVISFEDWLDRVRRTEWNGGPVRRQKAEDRYGTDGPADLIAREFC